MKEKTYIIENELKRKKDFTAEEISDIIELSYRLKGVSRVEKLENLINSYSKDAKNTWAAFIMYCCTKYWELKLQYLSEFIEEFLDESVDFFIETCFTEDEIPMYYLDLEKLKFYIDQTFVTDASLVCEIAKLLKDNNKGTIEEIYKGDKILVEEYIKILILILNRANINVDIEELIDHKVMRREK